MRLCYLADGKSIHTQRWLSAFVKRGHEVHLIMNRTSGVEGFKGIQLHSLEVPRLGNWLNDHRLHRFYYMSRYLNLKRLLLKIRPDVLHGHFVSGLSYWGARSGFHPFVLTAWGTDLYIFPKQSKTEEENVRFTLSQADLVTADSDDLCREAAKLGAAWERIHRIQWGVDRSRFRPDCNKNKLREQLELNHCPVVLSNRSFKSKYNIDTIVRAIPLVLKEIPNARFILKDCYGEAAEQQKIKQLCHDLNVVAAVRFIGEVPYEELPDFYRASNVYLSVPSSDGTSVSLLEAMACGTVPIVSDLPSAREWIVDEENGLVVPVRDHKALARAIVRLLKEPALRQKCIERNLQIIAEKADHDSHMDRMESLYYSLL